MASPDFFSDLEQNQLPDFYSDIEPQEPVQAPPNQLSNFASAKNQADKLNVFSQMDTKAIAKRALQQIKFSLGNDIAARIEQHPQEQAPDFLGDLQAAEPQQQSKLSFVPSAAKEKSSLNPYEKKQNKLLEAFQEGVKESASGELAQIAFGEFEQRAQTDPSFWSDLVKEAGTITGDLPYLAAGASLGGALGAAAGAPAGPAGAAIGGVLGGGFGAMAMGTFVKESIKEYRDYVKKGHDVTYGEFLERAGRVGSKTLNSGLMGSILGMTQKAMPLLKQTPGLGKLFETKAAELGGKVVTEAGIATTVPALAAGRLPEKEDFAKALALFAGFNLAHLPANAREAIQKQGEASGLSPKEFAERVNPEKAAKLKNIAEQRASEVNQVEKTPQDKLIPSSLKRVLPKPPDKSIEALKEAEARKSISQQAKLLDEAVSFETKEPKNTDPKTEGSFRTAVIDELYPLQRYVESAGVKDLPITEDPYRMARLHKGWSGKAETFLEHKTFDPETLKWKGKGLREIIKPYNKDLQGLSKYLVARRAVELSKQGKETGIDVADANRYIKENAKTYEKARQEIRDYQNDVLDYAEKSGLISPETKDLWKELNQNYVPFQRVIDEPESEFFGKSMQPKKQFYELKGSKRPIVDPLESIIGNTYTIIRASEQNNVLRSLVEFDKKHKGAAEFIEAKEIGEAEPTLKNFYEYLKGDDVVRDDSIRFFDNGKLKTYKVPKEIAEVLKGNLKPQEMGFLARMINYPTRAVRMGAITLSPGTLAKLATIDQIEAFLYTDIGYVPYFDMARGLFNAIKKPELYHQWKAAGGDQALAREMSRTIKQQKLKQVAGKADKNTFTTLDGLLRAVENLSRPLEESTRLAVFEKTLKRKGQSPEALREAALAAREATLDFAKKGAKTKLAAQAIPFFNSAIQGADKFFQEVKKNPKLIPKAIASVTLPTLALYYANKDRKEYQELPEWEKDAFWHFYADADGDTIHLKMPKPFELGTVFATVSERLAAYANDKNPDNLKQIPEALWETFTPSFTPAVATPFLESALNKNLFTGAPLIPERLKKLSPVEQATPYTSETAKRIGKLMFHVPFVGDTRAASPIEIEHWLNAWTGGLGNTLLKATDAALEKTGAYPERVLPEKELSDYPVLKSFFGKKGYTTQAASIRKFYEEYDKIEKLHNSLKQAVKEGRQSDIPDKHAIVARFKQAQQIRKVFAKNFSIIRNILEDQENYTSAEKKILIDQVAKDMVGVSRQFLGKEE